jgi:hypothetical protein
VIPAEAVRVAFAKEGARSKQVSESNADGNDDAIIPLKMGELNESRSLLSKAIVAHPRTTTKKHATFCSKFDGMTLMITLPTMR